MVSTYIFQGIQLKIVILRLGTIEVLGSYFLDILIELQVITIAFLGLTYKHATLFITFHLIILL